MKIKLTEEQISTLIAAEMEQLKRKFEKDVDALKKKYEYFEVSVGVDNVPTNEKKRLTNDEWKTFFNSGKSNADIAKETGYNASYISLKKRKVMEG